MKQLNTSKLGQEVQDREVAAKKDVCILCDRVVDTCSRCDAIDWAEVDCTRLDRVWPY